MQQNTEEFERFNALLTSGKPDYVPWYFKLSEDKDPDLSVGSWKAPTARITVKQAVRHLRSGKNVGIAATGDDGLVIIDIDDIGITPNNRVLPTLSVTSRKRVGRHYFYFTKDIKAKQNIATEDAGEVRANWQYVVAPGSYVVTGEVEIVHMPEEEQGLAGRYTLLNASVPAMIKFEQFPEVFLEQIRRNEEMERIAEERDAQRAKEQTAQTSHTSSFRSALYDLTITDVVGKIDNPRKRFPSLFHGSETGKNTTVMGGLLYCWRHNVTHTAMSALAVIADVASCSVAGYGMRGSGKGRSGVDFSDGMVIFRLWKFAKEAGMIPEDDPIPIQAFRAYAEYIGIYGPAASGQMTDVQYDQTIICLEQIEKTNSGRRRASTFEV
jgi:putative DNA primase/helicase